MLPFVDMIPWLQMLEYAPVGYTQQREFNHRLEYLTGPDNKYEQKRRLIKKLKPFLIWSPTNLKPFEMYMTAFYRALKTGQLKEGQDLVNDFCGRPEYQKYTHRQNHTHK